MLNSLRLWLQYILPKQLLTYFFGWYANRRAGFLTKLSIDLFIKYYKIDMEEAQESDTAKYYTFNDFFIRTLRTDSRPINTDPTVLTMPADGIINQLGTIHDDLILQSKNHSYSLEALLAGNHLIANQFRNGIFIVIYLSPRDYHRIHMPCNGILREMIYVPGTLFSINTFTTQNIKNIFARNERVICVFDTEFGPMAQILIGSTIVGSIETVWNNTITPPREGIIKRWVWSLSNNNKLDSISLLKGQEMGLFKLGSTVINLFAPNRIKLLNQIKSLSVAKVGKALAVSSSAHNNDMSNNINNNITLRIENNFKSKSCSN